jgi:hypothetical protein
LQQLISVFTAQKVGVQSRLPQLQFEQRKTRLSSACADRPERL